MTAIKFAPQYGSFSPQIGAIVGYTYRKYTSLAYDNYYYDNINNYNGSGLNDAESGAFDVGFSLGADVKVARTFIVGAEYRYMTNLTNKTDSRYLNDYYNYYDISTPLEEFNYYTISVVGKFFF
jgi:hypothetical protein